MRVGRPTHNDACFRFSAFETTTMTSRVRGQFMALRFPPCKKTNEFHDIRMFIFPKHNILEPFELSVFAYS
jgi:hypothetical protein